MSLAKALAIKHPYYNFDKVMSYNAVYNFVIGGRGLGKTYGAKKMVIRNAINKGEMFVYLRRYKTEMGARVTFFADIQHEFPAYEFRVNGLIAEYAPIETAGDKKREWTTMGYFVALSTAQSLRGMSFHTVTTIIFDEFIIEKSALQYLPNESDVFNGFYSTVDRWKDKTRVLFLANSVSITNPYFIRYEIRPTEDTPEYIRMFNGFVCVHFAYSDAFATSVGKTKFGQFIQGTEYADYAIGNEFADNSDTLIEMKDEKARYQYTIETSKGTFSVWVNNFSGRYYALARRPKQELIYVTEPSKMSEEKVLLLRQARPLQVLRTAFSHDMMRFDTPVTRNAMIEIFKR